MTDSGDNFACFKAPINQKDFHCGQNSLNPFHQSYLRDAFEKNVEIFRVHSSEIFFLKVWFRSDIGPLCMMQTMRNAKDLIYNNYQASEARGALFCLAIVCKHSMPN